MTRQTTNASSLVRRRWLRAATICSATALLTSAELATCQAVAEETAEAQPAYHGAPLSLEFQDVELRRALQLVADVAGLNLVADDAVAGHITVRLQDVPWDEALDVLLAAGGLAKRQRGNVLLVAPAEALAEREARELAARQAEAAAAPLHTAFLRIRYADAETLAGLLTSEGGALTLTDRGRAVVDERTNSLILTDTDANLAALKPMIAQLDIPVRQVQIEARIVNANDNFSEQLGIRWGVGLSTDQLAAVPWRRTGTAGHNVGVGSVSAGSADGTFTARAVGPGYWLDVELSALVDTGKARIIARPKVVTTDKRTALIESGVEIPYQQATESGATSIAFKDAVLQLQVTPRIAPNGRIVMDLEVKQDNVGRLYYGVPSINTTRMATQVLVDDGETVVLGGIFQSDDHHAVTRTPLFGSLPVVGRAFRRKTERNDKQELFIFVTPMILPDAEHGDADGDAAAPTAGSGHNGPPAAPAEPT